MIPDVIKKCIRDEIGHEIQGPCACGKLKCALPYQKWIGDIEYKEVELDPVDTLPLMLKVVGRVSLLCTNCNEIHSFESTSVIDRDMMEDLR